MNALAHLATLLKTAMAPTMAPDVEVAKTRPALDELDSVIRKLHLQVRQGAAFVLPEDQQRQAVQQFWASGRLSTLKEARLVAFGMALPHEAGGASMLDDLARTQTFLQAVDAYRGETRRYRRIYQGLVRSYFNVELAPRNRAGVEFLRVYLAERLPRIEVANANPDWVQAALANPHVFGPKPSEPHAAAMLRGDTTVVDALCLHLGISPTSWFVRELVLAQLREAVKLPDGAFATVLDRMLELLGRTPVLRDRGVALLLDRYANMKPPEGALHVPFHRGLHHAAVLCWGNPWLLQDASRWGHVSDSARAMVARWLKLELIDVYFAEYSVDGAKDTRRAAFWKRYVDGLDELQLVLPDDHVAGETGRAHDAKPGATSNTKAGTALLRRKLDGLTLSMRHTPGKSERNAAQRPREQEAAAAHPLRQQDAFVDTALIMYFGSVAVVEFGRSEHGMYGYGDRQALPFDRSQPLTTVDPAPNTLRHPSRTLWLQHRDGLRGWATWELMFESLLKRQYGIEPGGRRGVARASHVDLSIAEADGASLNTPDRDQADVLLDQSSRTGLSAHWQTAEAGAVAFGRAELAIFSRVHGLEVEDQGMSGGKLWVRHDASDESVAWVLSRWGFEYVEGEGWFRG